MKNISQELLQDPEMRVLVSGILKDKKKELKELKKEHNSLKKYTFYFAALHPTLDTLAKTHKNMIIQDKIIILERDVRHIEFSLKIASGEYEEGEYEVLFEKAKQLDMKHVYELTTGEQVKRGNVCCIFHKERTPSMKIYEDSFHCFGCGAHGDVIDFIQKKNNCSHKEALEYLSNV